MKILFLVALLATGCSSKKKDKEFQASLDNSDTPTQVIEVEAPPKLLEKFEVDEAKVEPSIAKNESQKKAETPNKKEPKKVEKKAEVKKPAKVESTQTVRAVSEVSKFPKDYPESLKEIDAKAQKTWDLYKQNHFVNEKVFLDINYLGMTVGKIMVTNRGKKMINGKEVWHFHSRFKSAPFYSRIYELDDTVDTYVTTDKFHSVRYSLIQRESKQNVDDLQLYDRDQMKTFWFFKQKKSDGTVRNKKKNSFIPINSIDPFSVLYLYQGLPLKDGDVYEIPVINKAKILILRSEVEGREAINTDEKKAVKAIRVHATTKYSGDTLKSGDMYFWFSDDEKHTLLKAQAKIKIGSVTADVVESQ